MRTHARGLYAVSILLLAITSPSGIAFAQQARTLSPQQIFKQASISVVVIHVRDSNDQTLTQGSGFIASPSGLIVTNQHVVVPEQAGVRLVVKLPNGDEYDDVSVVRVDERRDFALVVVKAAGLQALELGDSDKVEVGDEVVAIGSPKGLELTLTTGTVSNVRSLTEGYRFIQHQTPISGGSSGSPLLNMNGQVVGINTFTFGGQNLNGAIPINYVKPYLQDPPRMTYQAYVASVVGEVSAPVAAGVPGDPAINQAEEAAYKAFFDNPREDAQRQVQLGEEFAGKFPESRYLESVYSRMVGAYLSLGDVDKLFVVGEKALQINPDNVDVLSVVAYAVPRRINPSEIGGPAKLQKVEQYSRHAIELLDGMAKPDGMLDDEFARAKNDKLAMAHSGLAMVNYHRQDYAGMASELEQATTLATSPDPSDFYLLGVSYVQVRRFADATTAFGKCAEVPWDFQDRCKQSKEQSEKQAALQPKN